MRKLRNEIPQLVFIGFVFYTIFCVILPEIQKSGDGATERRVIGVWLSIVLMWSVVISTAERYKVAELVVPVLATLFYAFLSLMGIVVAILGMRYYWAKELHAKGAVEWAGLVLVCVVAVAVCGASVKGIWVQVQKVQQW